MIGYFGSQGKIPRVYQSGIMVGPDENQARTNNSAIYRGRPYSQANLIDQKAIDFQREVAKEQIQRGKRVVGIVMTTSSRPLTR